jgi:hypothetical protein
MRRDDGHVRIETNLHLSKLLELIGLDGLLELVDGSTPVTPTGRQPVPESSRRGWPRPSGDNRSSWRRNAVDRVEAVRVLGEPSPA